MEDKSREWLVKRQAPAQSHMLTARQALARAVYNRKPIIILDDVFKGLDADTYDKCFSAILGPRGLLRRSRRAIIMATHNSLLDPRN